MMQRTFVIDAELAFIEHPKSQEGFGRMNTGLTKSQIESEVLRAVAGESQIEAVFGFGSFFRGEAFTDVDLAIIFTEDCSDTLAVYEQLIPNLKLAQDSLGVRFDITPLTVSEFRQRPLRDQNRLVLLFQRTKREPDGEFT